MTPQLGHYEGAVYQILTTTTGLSGTFAGLTVNGTFAGSMTLDYASSPASVDLNVTGASLLTTPSGANQNQQNVIRGINNGILNSPANTPLPSQFLGLGGLSGPSLLGAATQLDGEANTGAERAALQLTNQFLALMLDPFVNGRGGVGSGSAAIGFAPARRRARLRFDPHQGAAASNIRKALERLGFGFRRQQHRERRCRGRLQQRHSQHVRLCGRDGLSRVALHDGRFCACRRWRKLEPRQRAR
jgi:hypothetical protein